MKTPALDVGMQTILIVVPGYFTRVRELQMSLMLLSLTFVVSFVRFVNFIYVCIQLHDYFRTAMFASIIIYNIIFIYI